MSDHRKISIRQLVPYPDLRSRDATGVEKAHVEAQRKLARRYRSFRCETALSADIPINDTVYTVHGRLDGYRRSRNGITIYEIKPVSGSASRWLHHPGLDRARWQLVLYGGLIGACGSPPWGAQKNFRAELCLIGTDGILHFEEIDLTDCRIWLEKRLQVVENCRRRSADPWPVKHPDLPKILQRDCENDRPIQQVAWQRLTENPADTRVLLSLPPGSGKTRIALRWALNLAHHESKPVYWITSRSRGREAVLAEMSRLAKLGLQLKTVWKTTPERLCDCRLPAHECEIRRHTLRQLFFTGLPPDSAEPQQSEMCKYELSRASEKSADVVIADFNYLLSSGTIKSRNPILILDEAQNIPGRVTAESNICITREEFRRVLSDLPRHLRDKYRILASPCWNDEDPESVANELWHDLSATLDLMNESSAEADKIFRMSSFLKPYPDQYMVKWFNMQGSSGWLGGFLQTGEFVRELLKEYPVCMALSGSLPASESGRQRILPGFEDFFFLSVPPRTVPDIYIIPRLDFHFPLNLKDHENACGMLQTIRKAVSPVIAVFGQNRRSNELLSQSLRVRGCTVMCDTDFDSWETAVAAMPDFLFMAFGGNLSESVNPPADLLQCAVILSPGFPALGPHDLFRRYLLQQEQAEPMAADDSWNIGQAVSRIIQAAGRVHRSPDRRLPVFLLNKDFAKDEYLDLLPEYWYQENPHDLICDSLADALSRFKNEMVCHDG